MRARLALFERRFAELTAKRATGARRPVVVLAIDGCDPAEVLRAVEAATATGARVVTLRTKPPR